MGRISASLVALSWAGLAFADEPARGSWEPIAYVGFIESIDKLAGAGAIDCGMHDLVVRKPTRREKRAVHGCVQDALRTGVPFKYGTQRVPMDSVATEVIVRAPDSTLWFIVHDIMLGDEYQQQWNQTCRAVTVDRKTMIIDISDCVLKSEGVLKIQ